MKAIKRISEINNEWIELVLKNKYNIPNGLVKSFEVLKNWDMVMSNIVTIKIHYWKEETDLPASLFIKTSKMNDNNQSNGVGRKEVLFYNQITSGMEADALPKCYLAIFDEESNVLNLVLENLEDTHFQEEWPVPPIYKNCEMALDSLSKIHFTWWDHPQLRSIFPYFRTEENCNEEFIKNRDTMVLFFEFLGDRISAERKKIINECIDFYHVVIQRFVSNKNITLVHRDPHFWNFMYPKNENQNVKLIDWDSWRIDIPTNDLAYMMAVHWFPKRRKEMEGKMLKRYYQNLVNHGIKNYTFDQLLNDYKISIVDMIFLPSWQWSAHLPASIWWNHLERICEAIVDLNCIDVLRENSSQ